MSMVPLPPLENVLRSLQQERLTFFPIRHHSPACAWHVQQWILAQKPAAVLIEAPADATDLIPLLLHPDTQTPVAIYTTYVDRDGHLLPAESLASNAAQTDQPGGDRPGQPKAGSHRQAEPLRFGGYYPFCDYSPEFVALRTGAAIGAQLQFIDLPYPQKVIAAQADCDATPRLRALQAEHHLQHSTYLSALAKKTGCRDFNELWDHLFEAHCQGIPTPDFIRQIATYCYLARQETPLDTLVAEGTLAREAAMAEAIATILPAVDGPVLVVTGGFHTVALPALVESPPAVPPAPKLSAGCAQTVLMRFSFEQLDALNGYASGMPAPAYYQQLWEQMQQPSTEALMQTAYAVLLQVRSLTCEEKILASLSVADEIAAAEQAQRLAQFRHHPGPTREDLLDAIRSCFIKGTMEGEGGILMSVVARSLRGDRIGNLPHHAGVPPLVEDFHQRAQTFRLQLATAQPKSLTLDIYRQDRHRQLSRFLHSLTFAEIPFARFTKGPDFVLGNQLNQIQEHWSYRWQPQTESTLIEQSLYGSTVAELALYHLRQQIAALAEEGQARSATAAVQLLITACRMGLHTQTTQLLALIADHVAADPSVVSLAQAIGQLLLLWQSREPLQAQTLETVPQLTTVAYQRLCYQIPHLAECPVEETPTVLEAFNRVWEILWAQGDLDRELFVEALLNLLTTQGNPIILGGAVGVLYSAGRMETTELVTLAAGYLDHAAADPVQGVGFLRGLLCTCREVTWHLPELIAAINARLEHWSEDEFLRVLPELRLAFADLIPRETDKVAAIAAQLHGRTDLGRLVHTSATETQLHEGLAMEQKVQQILAQDGLSHWLTLEEAKR
ncbi:MAG: hypothetical protein F6J95_015400 [Leptolyngbya sp. SIO1E4]|nr:hypothetical protein [Leptolyngbya sp. SIO1E4]